jgi:DNA-binding transcriptional LysR family regulator
MLKILDAKIEYFLRSAQERSLSAAAFKIGISQSGLSMAIKQLEENIGITLFNRLQEGISLTRDGELFFNTMVAHQKVIESELANGFNQTEITPLRIGSVDHFALRHLLPALEAVKDASVPVSRLVMLRSLSLLLAVQQSRLDFAFISWTKKPGQLLCQKIMDERVAIVGRKGRFDRILKVKNFSELENEPWVFMPKPQYDWSQEMSQVSKVWIVEDFHTLRTVLLDGLAIGEIQLDVFSESELNKLVQSRIRPLHDHVAVYVIYRSDLSKTKKKFLESLVVALRQNSGR